MSNPLEAAFDREEFRALGHRIVDLLADRLGEDLAGDGRVRMDTAPDGEYAHWRNIMNSGTGGAGAFLEEFVGRAIRLHHPGYMGHQVCGPAPLAALAGFVGEWLNNGMAVYEMGPGATVLERWVVEQTSALFGFENGGGFLTSGGTLAMLTALLGARARKLGAAVLEHGSKPEWALLGSEQAHYCAGRAAHVMGWGREGYVGVPVDARFRMRVDLLESVYRETLAAGRTPVAVVGSACTTSTGSYDELQAIADFCERYNLWFHVDGAHGGAAAFCPELRERLAGIERADSVILDFHKLLLTPALATAVIFRDAGASWAAFQQKAEYLWEASAQEEWFNVGRRSFECTKLSMSLKIAALWKVYGVEIFAENVRRVHAIAERFARMLGGDGRFELAVWPESNIVCFRLKAGVEDGMALDDLQRSVRARCIGLGEFYIVQTVLNGRIWLRTALMNPFTRDSDLAALLERVAQLGCV
jgi:L-2,4-diaminobutyrate decarboxylase